MNRPTLSAPVVGPVDRAKTILVTLRAQQIVRNTTRFGALVAAVVLVAAGAASAAFNESGIRMLGYDVATSTQSAGEGISWPGTIDVTFQNDRETAAKDVRFAFVGDDQRTYVIDDAGTFAPNVRIHHRFQHDRARAGASIEIVHVEYADGSQWSSDDLARPPLRQETDGHGP